MMVRSWIHKYDIKFHRRLDILAKRYAFECTPVPAYSGYMRSHSFNDLYKLFLYVTGRCQYEP